MDHLIPFIMGLALFCSALELKRHYGGKKSLFPLLKNTKKYPEFCLLSVYYSSLVINMPKYLQCGLIF